MASVSPKQHVQAAVGRLVQTGMARLQATATTKNATDSSYVTRLTEVAHQSPNRLIPLRSSATERAGACVCALSSYGGGMVQGDSSFVNIHVQPNARLGVITQGSNRIYDSSEQRMRVTRTGSSASCCQSTIQARIDSSAFLVLAPDPCTPFAGSSLTQELVLDLHDSSSSVVLVDWFSAGRIHMGELWHLAHLSSKIKMKVNQKLIMIEALELGQHVRRDDCFGFWCDHKEEPLTTFGSVVMHGIQAYPVVQRFQALQEQLVGHHTSIRQSIELPSTTLIPVDVRHFRGRVIVGVSGSCEPGAYMARIAATCTEDLYRVLHSALQPLGKGFGYEFYKDRLQSSQSASFTPSTTARNVTSPSSSTSLWHGWCPTPLIQKSSHQAGEDMNGLHKSQRFDKSSSTSSSSWMSCILTDSSLPTGGFAHSASLEAASQLEWFKGGNHNNGEALSAYIQAATRSTMQLQIPLILAGYSIIKTTDDPTTAMDQWRQLDDYTHALLNFNSPACRASLDQGQSLLRITKLLAQDGSLLQLQQLDRMHSDIVAASSSSTRGHFAPMFGICGGMLLPDHDSSEAEICTILGYCIGRALVSAAIRLNLIGPMASLPLLVKTEPAAIDGIQAAYASIRQKQEEMPSADSPSLECFLHAAASSAPLVDAIHTCHDLLQTRLFRT